MDNGSWKGQQLVPEGWVANSTQSSLNPPTDSTYGYGYQWWLHPNGIYSAWGYAHQRVIVVPEYKVVATFTSNMPTTTSDPASYLVNQFVLPSIFSHPDYTEPPESSENKTTSFTLLISPLLLIILIRKRKSLENK